MLKVVKKNTPFLKTRGIISYLESSKRSVLLIPNKELINEYPKEFHDRIFTISQFLNNPTPILGKRFSDYRRAYPDSVHPLERYEIERTIHKLKSIVIDSPYSLPEEIKAELIYKLGSIPAIDTFIFIREKVVKK